MISHQLNTLEPKLCIVSKGEDVTNADDPIEVTFDGIVIVDNIVS
jgi:hypothetical protein